MCCLGTSQGSENIEKVLKEVRQLSVGNTGMTVGEKRGSKTTVSSGALELSDSDRSSLKEAVSCYLAQSQVGDKRKTKSRRNSQQTNRESQQRQCNSQKTVRNISQSGRNCQKPSQKSQQSERNSQKSDRKSQEAKKGPSESQKQKENSLKDAQNGQRKAESVVWSISDKVNYRPRKKKENEIFFSETHCS